VELCVVLGKGMQGKIIHKDISKCNHEDYSDYYDTLEYALDGVESLEETYDEQANFMNTPASILTGAIRYKSVYHEELQEAQDTLGKSQDSFEKEDYDLALHLLQKAEDHIVTSRLYWSLFTGEAGGDNTGGVVERQSKKFFLAAIGGKVYDEHPVTAETILEMEARETGDWKRHDDVSAEWEDLIDHIKDQVNTEKEGRSYSETDKVALAIQLFQEQQYGLYTKDQNTLTHMLSERGGNCVAQTLSMIGLFESMSFWYPKGIELGIQVYQDHLVPVLYNTETNRVWDLWTGGGLNTFHDEEVIPEPTVPIYEPQYLYYSYLRKKHRLSDYDMERLHLAGPRPDEVVADEVHITGTGEKMFSFSGGSTAYLAEDIPKYLYEENNYADTLILGSRELFLQPPGFLIRYADGVLVHFESLCYDYDEDLEEKNQDPIIANSMINVNELNQEGLEDVMFELRCYGRLHEAVEVLQLLIRNEPNNTSFYIILGSTYGNLQQYTLAIKQYEKAIEIDPTSESAYYNQALAYKNMGENEIALVHFQEVLIMFPKFYLKDEVTRHIEELSQYLAEQSD
jgi:tetratricopeptide (TPR) repeat protein